MSVLIKDEGFQDDDLSGIEFIGLDKFSDGDRYLDLPSDINAIAIMGVFDQVDAIRIHFASFSDGRGFSLARQLRTLGYTGRLRAYGHLISDQYSHARRCGFDEAEIETSQSLRQPENQWNADWRRESYQDRLLRAG